MAVNQTLKRRGRPGRVEDRHLWSDLLHAAEECLVSKSPDELTRRDIATMAGTNSAMIGYYFHNKEGLLRALLSRLMQDLTNCIVALEESLLADPSQPTRRIVASLMEAYRANTGACRILAVELTKANSAIKNTYLAEDAVVIMERIANLLASLVAAGIYAPDADLRHVAVTIRLLVTHSLFGPSAWSVLALSGVTASEGTWIDHVVDLLDRQLRPIHSHQPRQAETGKGHMP